MKKYEFTDEKMYVGGKTLRRVRALVNIPLHGVKAGDLGGFIEGEHNLNHEDSRWVGNNARVYDFGGGTAVMYDFVGVPDNVGGFKK